MEGTCPRTPCRTDERPPLRTEPPGGLPGTSAESIQTRQSSHSASDEPDLRIELYELGLLVSVLLGSVALAGAIL